MTMPNQAAPGPVVYATVAQYQAATGDQATPQALVQQLLTTASECVDQAMIAAVYPVDPATGMPSIPWQLDLFVRATIAQASFLGSLNDPDFVKSQYTSTSMGGVSTSRAASAVGQVLPPLAPRAAQILHTGGALPSAPLLGW